MASGFGLPSRSEDLTIQSEIRPLVPSCGSVAVGSNSPSRVPEVLDAVEAGRPGAAEELVPLVYSELRKLARALLARGPKGVTLQPTALVHEAYLRLVGRRDPGWNGRGHFFGAAALAMRRILVERARRRAAARHGGGMARSEIDPDDLPIDEPLIDILALDQAIERLQQQDDRKAKVVLLRFFAGLTIPETAAAIGVSEATVERDWAFARVLLYDQIASSGGGDPALPR